jgi:hypothetical protein
MPKYFLCNGGVVLPFEAVYRHLLLLPFSSLSRPLLYFPSSSYHFLRVFTFSLLYGSLSTFGRHLLCVDFTLPLTVFRHVTNSITALHLLFLFSISPITTTALNKGGNHG